MNSTMKSVRVYHFIMVPGSRCFEWSDLRDPLFDSVVDLEVLHNGPQGVLCQHDDGEELKVVRQLPRVDEESEHQLLNPHISHLDVDQSLVDIVEWFLDALIFLN